MTFPTDEEISSAWEIGFLKSQSDFRELGIKPDSEDEADLSNNWFFCPHEIDSTTEEGIYAQMWQDGDNLDIAAGVVNEAEDRHVVPPQNNDNNMADNYFEQYPELGLHLRQLSDQNHLRESDLSVDTNRYCQLSSQRHFKLTVNINGVVEVHKSTLCSVLNSNPQGLSTDRLKRVRSKTSGTHLIERESGTKMTKTKLSKSWSFLINHQNELCLFDDVAVHVKSNPSGRPSFQLVRVIRMRNYGRGHTEYK